MRSSALPVAILCIIILTILAAPICADDCGCGGGGSGSEDDGTSSGDPSDADSSSGYESGADSVAFAVKARDLYSQGRFGEALTAYNDSLVLDPYNTPTLMGKGEVLFSMQRYPEAVLVYREVLSINPSHDEAYLCLGNTYLVLREFQAAADAYEQLLRINPGNSPAFENLQVALHHLEGTVTPTPPTPAPSIATEPEPALTTEPTTSAPVTIPPTAHSLPFLQGEIGVLAITSSLVILLVGRQKV